MAEKPLTKAKWIEAALVRYEQPLIRKAIRITGDFELARDVVQDTFLKLCKADRSQIEDHLAAWLFTVCRNRALDVQKKERRMGRLDDPPAIPEYAANPAEKASVNETLALVQEALDSLTDEHREAFRLKFQDQLTYREISDVTGRSLGTVSRLITAALCAVRDRLQVGGKLVQER